MAPYHRYNRNVTVKMDTQLRLFVAQAVRGINMLVNPSSPKRTTRATPKRKRGIEHAEQRGVGVGNRIFTWCVVLRRAEQVGLDFLVPCNKPISMSRYRLLLRIEFMSTSFKGRTNHP